MNTAFMTLAVEPHVRILHTWPWYLTRASGIIASISLVLLMITGITMFIGYEFKFMQPLKAWANHRTLGIVFSVSVAVHVLSLLFDKFISFNVVQILVPFTSDYKKMHLWGLAVGSIGVALGVFSLYLVIAIVYTSLTKNMTHRPTLWRWTHYLSYAVMLLIFFHSIMIGTDLKNGLWRWSWIVANVIILVLVGMRLRRVGSLRP
jgi:methionine sulfoxide reductase heme-binding subunit